MCAQDRKKRQVWSSPEEDRQTVAAIDVKYQQAVKRNDADTMGQVLDDHFILVLGNGTVWAGLAQPVKGDSGRVSLGDPREMRRGRSYASVSRTRSLSTVLACAMSTTGSEGEAQGAGAREMSAIAICSARSARCDVNERSRGRSLENPSAVETTAVSLILLRGLVRAGRATSQNPGTRR